MPAEPARKIKAKQAAADFNSGMAENELMLKYDLSPGGLKKLHSKLVEVGMINPAPLKKAVGESSWVCPYCGTPQDQSFAVCPDCGVDVSEYSKKLGHASDEYPADIAESRHTAFKSGIHPGALQGESDESKEGEGPFVPEVRHMDRDAWIMLAAGIGAALLIQPFFWLSIPFLTMKTLVHEMGHAIFGWMFAYPAIPAFDALHGGGVTLLINRSVVLVVLIYCGLSFLFYSYRKNVKTIVALAAITIGYSLISFTKAHSVLISFMGHGTEVLIGSLFIYRALAGRSIIHYAERPLYSMIGFYMIFYDVWFSYKLLKDDGFFEEYLDGKGGMDNDFVVIANDFLHVRVEAVVRVFLALCFLAPLLSFLWYRYEEYLYAGLLPFIKRDPAGGEELAD